MEPRFAFIVVPGGRGGHAVAKISRQVLHLERVHNIARIGDHVAEVGCEIAPPLQIVER
jgi:hypothetical protein